MNRKSLYKKYLICPKCGGDLETSKKLRCKKCAKIYEFLDKDIPDFFTVNESNKMIQQKWEEFFQSEIFQKKAEEEFREVFLDDTLRQILSSTNRKGEVYLEIGCGQGYIGEELAETGWFFIGIDFSKAALLQLKRRLNENAVANFLLIRADINELPIKDDSVDLIYGGGVIEHLEDYQRVVNHLHRSLKPKGVSFNTVPLFNIGNLVYRSFWGGIPNIPVLKQLAEFFHIKVLGARHMVFGYELQFTERQLINMHTKAGFKKKNVKVAQLECFVQVHRLRNYKKLREFFRNLCSSNKNFWPMVKVIARKL